MKNLLMISLALTLLLGVAPAHGAARPDPRFGAGGKVLLRDASREANGTALLADGRVIVAQPERMLALLPSGKIDRSFGEGGFASLFAPPGSTSASIADVLVDSMGRLVVAGLADSKVLVERYTADGRVDPRFGGGDGYSITDFGLPPADPGVPPTVFVPPPSNLPELSAIQAALDPSNQIVITGARRSGWQQVKTFWIGAYEPFVARLTAEGEPDQSFAGGGAVQLAGFERINSPIAVADDGVYVAPSRPSGTMLLHLLPSGAPDPGFGHEGWRPAPGGTEGGVIRDSGGDLLFSGLLSGSLKGQLATGVSVKRLRADGSLDRGFGRRGSATLRLPRMLYGVLAADERGGVLIGLPQRERRKLGRRPAALPGFALARLRPDGSLDRSFGRRGIIEIPFRRGWEVTLSELEVRGSEVLLTGGWCGDGKCGGVLTKVGLGTP